VGRASPVRGVRQRILDAGFAESLEPELARIAYAARLRATEVAGPREGPRHPEFLSSADDVRLRHPNQRGADLDDVAVDTPLRAKPGDLLEGRVELGSAIDVARVIDRIRRDDNRLRSAPLGEPERIAEEDCVAGGNVRDRSAPTDLFEAPLPRHGDPPVG